MKSTLLRHLPAAIPVALIALLCGAAGPAAAQTLSFKRLSSLAGDMPAPNGGRQQTAALTVDIDKDGDQDIFVTERTAAPSVILYRRSKTGWDKHVVDDTRQRIEAGGAHWDIDGDGDQDIVFGGDGQSEEVWWWENPYPKLDPKTPWTRRIIKRGGGRKHHDQIFGDFDGDGGGDLVFWNQGARKLLFAPIPKDPKNTQPWPAHQVFSWEGQECEGLAQFDVNGDGKLDIVGGGRWFEHAGGVTFREHVIDDAQRFSRAGAAQFVKGGWAEVVFVVGDGKGWLSLYQHANGKWEKKGLLDHEVVHGHSLRVADMNKDGNPDIFLGEMGKWSNSAAYPDNPHANVWIFYGDGKGNFRKELVSRGIGVHEARVADLDGDGDLDIVAKPYNFDTPRMDVFLNEGRPRKGAAKPALDKWQRHVVDSDKPWRAIYIESIDLDGDAKKDIVSGGWWYRNPGSPGGAWKRAMVGDPLNNLATIADYDGDGDYDILGTKGKASEKNPEFVWARNDGKGNFEIMSNVPAGQGDFLQGVVAASLQPGGIGVALSWHRAKFGIQLLQVSKKGGPEPWTWSKISDISQDEDLSAGDIDRDGDNDLLLGTKWLRNDGAGKWTPFTLHPTGDDPDRNRLADINGDGRWDAVVGFEAINVPGKVAWYEQPSDPTSQWTEHLIGDIVGPMSLDAADLDHDGDIDLVVGEHNYKQPETAALWVLENVDGAGTKWARHKVSTGDEHHDGARLVDIDGDGDMDIVSLGWSHARVLLYENKAIDRPKR